MSKNEKPNSLSSTEQVVDFLKNKPDYIATEMIKTWKLIILPSQPTLDYAWDRYYGNLSPEELWISVGGQLYYGGSLKSIERWLRQLLSVPDSICDQGYTNLAIYLDQARSINYNSDIDLFHKNIIAVLGELGYRVDEIESDGKLLDIYFGLPKKSTNVVYVKIPPKEVRERYLQLLTKDSLVSEEKNLHELFENNSFKINSIEQLGFSVRAQTFKVEFTDEIGNPNTIVVKIVEPANDEDKLPNALKQTEFLQILGSEIAAQPIAEGKIFEFLTEKYSKERIILTPFIPNGDLQSFISSTGPFPFRVTAKIQDALIGKSRMRKIILAHFGKLYRQIIEEQIAKGFLLKDVRLSNFLLSAPIESIFRLKKPDEKLLVFDVEHVVTRDELGDDWDKAVEMVRREMKGNIWLYNLGKLDNEKNRNIPGMDEESLKKELEWWTNTYVAPWMSMDDKEGLQKHFGQIARMSKRNDVLISASSGAGKSSLLRELAWDFHKRGVNVVAWSAKRPDVKISWEDYYDDALTSIRDLLSNPKMNKRHKPVLFIDNIDYLWVTTVDSRELRSEILSLLKELRSVRIIATWHSNWPEEIIDSDLKKFFDESFVDGKEYFMEEVTEK